MGKTRKGAATLHEMLADWLEQASERNPKLDLATFEPVLMQIERGFMILEVAAMTPMEIPNLRLLKGGGKGERSET